MTDLRCGARCGRPAKGGVICPACAHRITVDLARVPSLREELDTAMTRQVAMRGSVGGRSCETPMPFDERAGNARRDLDEAVAEVHAAAAEMAQRLGPNELRDHEDAATLYRHLTEAVAHGTAIVDRPPDRWYAGACGYDDEDRDDPCAAELYVEVGEMYVTCPSCGERWDVTARRDHLLDVVRDRLAHAALLEVALDQLDMRLTAATIRQWAKRKHITAVDSDHKGRPRYRVGDVLDRILEEERKVTERLADKSI